MKKSYTPNKNRLKKLGFLLTCLAGALPYTGSSQLTYTFTNAGATGSVGPTQTQVNTAYASTNLNGLVTVTNGIQYFTVPSTAPYRIVAIGGQGGYQGGHGAYASGDYTLTAGTVLKVLVGQLGLTFGNTNSPVYTAGGGGGGSFVTSTLNVPYVVGGGGGGNGDGYTGTSVSSTVLAMQGSTTTSGSSGGNYSGNNGTGGNGGTCGSASAGAGAGFNTDGSICNAGLAAVAYTNGGAGGQSGGFPATGADGGFGGGGGTYNSGVGNRGGGGGGYSGGGGGDAPNGSEPSAPGGGGGSYSSGANPTFSVSTLTGAGQVMLVLLCDVNLTSSGSNSLAPIICSGQSLTLTTNAAPGSFTWSTGNTTSNTIVVTPTAALSTYTVAGASPSLGCNNTAVINVTVSPAAPVLTITSSSTTPCFGNTITLSATGALTYTWANPGVVNGGTVAPPNGTTVYTVSGTNGCGTTSTAITITASPLPVTIAASSQLVCSATPVTLTATGATNYTWTPGLNATSNPFITNPASNTTYTVVGMTGPCAGSNTISISTKPNPSMSISSSNSIVCDGSSANLTVSGDAVTYTWNPGGQNGTNITVTPTITTLFSVTGTNSVNCVSTVQQVLLVMPNPTVNTTVSDAVVCSGGASTLSASGASTYVWTNGSNSSTTVVNPTANSTYTVTGTATNNCVGTATAAVSVIQPSIGVSSATAICSGSAAVISANGASTYTWSNGAGSPAITVSPTLTTVYTVTGSVIDPNSNISCDASGSIQVSINPSPVVTASADHSVICLGTSAVLTGAGASTYTWTGGSGVIASASISVSPIANQTFSVAGTDANGCVGKASITEQVSACTGIANISATNNSLMIYPNPSSGEFTISSDQEITLYLSNELGQQVKTITLNAANHEAKVNSLSNGIYFITGANSNGSVKEKIIIAK